MVKRTKIGHYGTGEPGYSATASVRCGRCHARGPTVTCDRIPSEQAHKLPMSARRGVIELEYEIVRQKAITAWNNRPEPRELSLGDEQ